MPTNTLKEMDRAELVNLKRLAYTLKGLSPAEFETLELLSDDASETIAQSLKEIKAGKRIHIDEW